LKEFRDGLDIPIGVGDVDVPEVGGEFWEFALHVASLAIPSDECTRGKPVPHVVEPRPVAVLLPVSRLAQADGAGDDHEVVPSAVLRDTGTAFG
jgi:hypothetical protein